MSQLAIGIDMGGTSLKLGVCEGAEVIFKDEPIMTKDFQGVDATVQEIARRVESLRRRYPAISALGIGVPGFTDVNTGLVHGLTNVPGWNGVYLAKILREATGLPSVAENDANCMGLAELHHGAGRGFKHFIAITLGTGVGGAVFLNGKLFRGANSAAGEIGQMSIDYQGVEKTGEYSNPGCLEKYTGNQHIAQRAAQLYTAAALPKTPEKCEPKSLAQAAKEGDQIALQVWDEFTSQLSTGLANCCWLLNPEAVIVGGGIAAAGELVFEPLRRKLYAQLGQAFRENLMVLPAHFGNEAGIIGAAALALETARGVQG